MNLFSNEFIQLAWSQIWQVTLLVILVAAVAKWLTQSKPHLTYLLWMLVILKCLTPPVWSSPTGIFTWAHILNRQAESRPAMADSEVVAITNVSTINAESLNQNADSWSDLKLDGSTDSTAESMSISTFLVVVWLTGFAIISLLYAAAAIHCFIQVRKHKLQPSDGLLATLSTLRQHLGLRRNVQVIVASHSLGPAVFGILRPTIVLPKSLVEIPSDETIKPILAHELVHVRRGDTFFGMVQLLVQIVWWFHPLVWWANRQMTTQRERLTDEETIAGLNMDHETYAQSLLDVLKLKRQASLLSLMPGVRPFDITKTRLEHIMSLPQMTKHRTPKVYWLVLLMGLGLILPGADLTSADDVAPASQQNKNNLTGSGLIYQLPTDATRVNFDMVATVERNGRQSSPNKGTISISSVGKKTVNGVQCRWIEFAIGMDRDDPERSKPAISKLLIPEEKLRTGADPINYIFEGYSQSSAQREARAVGPRILPQDGPLYALLPGQMKDIKTIPSKSIKTSLGTLECQGLAGHIDFKERGQDITISYEIYRHEKAPFGVVAYHMQIENKKNGKTTRKANMNLTLRDVEENVQSEMPAFAVIPGIKQNEIIQTFLKRVIAGEDEAAKKLVDPNSAVGRQLSDFRELTNFENLRIVKLYLGKDAVMGVSSPTQTKRKKDVVIVIFAKRKDDRYIVDDIDAEDPKGLDGEVARFAKKHAPVTFVEFKQDAE